MRRALFDQAEGMRGRHAASLREGSGQAQPFRLSRGHAPVKAGGGGVGDEPWGY